MAIPRALQTVGYFHVYHNVSTWWDIEDAPSSPTTLLL